MKPEGRGNVTWNLSRLRMRTCATVATPTLISAQLFESSLARGKSFECEIVWAGICDARHVAKRTRRDRDGLGWCGRVNRLIVGRNFLVDITVVNNFNTRNYWQH